MRLRVLLPTEILVDSEVEKVAAEGMHGAFCLLPRHIDFVSALTSGILTYAQPGEGETFMAIDEGVLVKQGDDVLVSTRDAIQGEDLPTLQTAVVEQFQARGERERITRTALAKLEADFIRRFIELRRNG